VVEEEKEVCVCYSQEMMAAKIARLAPVNLTNEPPHRNLRRDVSGSSIAS
jgi:hypothetical protein